MYRPIFKIVFRFCELHNCINLSIDGYVYHIAEKYFKTRKRMHGSHGNQKLTLKNEDVPTKSNMSRLLLDLDC